MKAPRLTRPRAQPSEQQPTAETPIVYEILAWIGSRRWARAWRNNTGLVRYTDQNGNQRRVRFGLKGQADITGILHDGKRLEIEVKKPGEENRNDERRKRQKIFQGVIDRFGGVYILARSLAEAREELLKRGYGDDEI